ncbi:MAG: DUF6152 family protein [Acidobacteriota bacterium]|nr:DUF6152 family protein [Acidobacteriota bacterium]
MRKPLTKSLLSVASLLLVAGSLWAHHGQSNSYATNHMWTTWATVEEFGYINPHPVLRFTRTDRDGKVEHWVAEVNDAPAILARSGWTKSRSMEALKPGTRVKLYLATALAGGFIAYVDAMENEKGEIICAVHGEQSKSVVDMDGVPGGYQPKPGDDKEDKKE